MAVLLVGLAIMAILMSAAVPVWRQASQREREEELIFRGNQYARALNLYQRENPNTAPDSLDVLIERRFLRKKYKDPMVPDGEFRLLYQSTQAGPARQGGGAQPGRGGRGVPQAPPPSPGQGRGRIIGVASTSTDTSLRVYNGRTRYNEWEFVYLQQTAQPGPVSGAGRQGGPTPRPSGRVGGPPPARGTPQR